MIRLGRMFTDEVIDFGGIEPGDVLGMDVETAPLLSTWQRHKSWAGLR